MRKLEVVIIVMFTIIVLLLATLIIVIAHPGNTIGIIQGGIIDRVGFSAGMAYSDDGTSWTPLNGDLPGSSIVDPLYARIETTGPGYSGLVTITWKLIDGGGAEIKILPNYTTVTLTGSAGQIVYASADGSGLGFNFGPDAGMPDQYYIQAEVIA